MGGGGAGGSSGGANGANGPTGPAGANGNAIDTYYSGGNTSGTITPNISSGTVQSYTLTGNIVLNSLTNVTTGSNLTLILTQDGTGFPDRTSSTISFNKLTRTFSLAPTGVNFSVWYRGREFVISTTKSVTLTNSNGGRYITYNYNTGNIQVYNGTKWANITLS